MKVTTVVEELLERTGHRDTREHGLTYRIAPYDAHYWSNIIQMLRPKSKEIVYLRS